MAVNNVSEFECGMFIYTAGVILQVDINSACFPVGDTVTLTENLFFALITLQLEVTFYIYL